MAIYDVEQFLRDIETLYKAKLNDEIAVINAEKTDFTLSDISDNAWYFQELAKQAFSYKNFVVYGILDDPRTLDTMSDNYIREVKVFLEVVIPVDGGKKTEAEIYKLLRYSRALESVALKNYDRLSRRVTRLKFETLKPNMIDIDDRLRIRSAGIVISAALTAR